MVTIKFGGYDGNVDYDDDDDGGDDDDDGDGDGDGDDDDGDDDDVDPAREEEEADLSAWLTPIDIIFPSSLASPVSHFPDHTPTDNILPLLLLLLLLLLLVFLIFLLLLFFQLPLAQCRVPSSWLQSLPLSLSLSLDELIRISTSPTNIISSALGLVSVNCY